MEERDKIIVKWAQEYVETSNNLLNKMILIFIYLLTATGLTPGGSSTAHSYTQNNTHTEQQNVSEYTEQNTHNIMTETIECVDGNNKVCCV